jgi:adenosylcobinamide-GDP ribazoletransferase
MRQALAFLTPFPGARRPTPAALRWFPVVGVLLGLLLGVLWWGSAKAFPFGVASVFVVVADLGLTGLLHVDGLADSADGLLPHLSRERRLEVMADPTVGAFGAATVAVVLLARWVALDATVPSVWLIAGLWCASRTAMATVVGRVPYARTDGTGLATAFEGSPVPLPLAVAAVFAAAAIASAWSTPAGPVAVAAAMGAFVAVVAFARHRLGGYTGDILGAAGIIAETVGLLVASARWS